LNGQPCASAGATLWATPKVYNFGTLILRTGSRGGSSYGASEILECQTRP
jgi:hypothetical protein